MQEAHLKLGVAGCRSAARREVFHGLIHRPFKGMPIDENPENIEFDEGAQGTPVWGYEQTDRGELTRKLLGEMTGGMHQSSLSACFVETMLRTTPSCGYMQCNRLANTLTLWKNVAEIS